jgi:hypothetical protein
MTSTAPRQDCGLKTPGALGQGPGRDIVQAVDVEAAPAPARAPAPPSAAGELEGQDAPPAPLRAERMGAELADQAVVRRDDHELAPDGVPEQRVGLHAAPPPP